MKNLKDKHREQEKQRAAKSHEVKEKITSKLKVKK